VSEGVREWRNNSEAVALLFLMHTSFSLVKSRSGASPKYSHTLILPF
jgi:hypothetical protein